MYRMHGSVIVNHNQNYITVESIEESRIIAHQFMNNGIFESISAQSPVVTDNNLHDIIVIKSKNNKRMPRPEVHKFLTICAHQRESHQIYSQSDSSGIL